MNGIAATSAPLPSGGVLYRSRIEIARILQSLADENIPVFAYVVDKEDEHLFISGIHSIHAETDYFVISYGAYKMLNSALFRYPALRFKANYRGGRISFVAKRPLDATLSGQPVIKFTLPHVLLHYYREYTRINVPGNASLRCIAGEPDEEQLDLQVIDISQDGMGCILHMERNRLHKGMVLRNCRISLPNGKAINADLMVRHSHSVTLGDGTLAYRTGVRFVQTPQEIGPLIEQFVRVLDDL